LIQGVRLAAFRMTNLDHISIHLSPIPPELLGTLKGQQQVTHQARNLLIFQVASKHDHAT